MNKILKVIIKTNPVFKYIVEDYPFYQGIFFNSIDYHKMQIIHTHYLFRGISELDKQTVKIDKSPHFGLRLSQNILGIPTNLICSIRSAVKITSSAEDYTYLNIKAHSYLRVKMLHRDYSKSTITAHLMRKTRLKTHDPFTLENRDMLTLKSMDGEIIT